MRWILLFVVLITLWACAPTATRDSEAPGGGTTAVGGDGGSAGQDGADATAVGGHGHDAVSIGVDGEDGQDGVSIDIQIGGQGEEG